jgi:FkbM family methyltransferase
MNSFRPEQPATQFFNAGKISENIAMHFKHWMNGALMPVRAALRAYGTSFPSHRGKDRIIDCVDRPLRWCAPHDLVAQLPGFTLDVNTADYLERRLYYVGWYERPTLDLFAQHLRAGDVCVDCGAHVGLFTMLAASIVGQEGRVIAFEPSAPNRRRLTSNLGRNGFSNVKINASAVADVSIPHCPFFVAKDDNSGSHSLAATRPFMVPDEEGVSVTTLDAELHDVVPNLIKIDVEGAELRVLKGATNLIRRARPNLILELCEPNLAGFGDTADGLLTWLRENEYDVFEITKKGPQTLLSPCGTCNLLCLPRPVLPALTSPARLRHSL